MNAALLFILLGMAVVAGGTELRRHSRRSRHGHLRHFSFEPEKQQEPEPAADAVSLAGIPMSAQSAKNHKVELSTKGDSVHREGLGENLPYPGVDYLGIGYDLRHGNPDGDPQTHVDPGFREPVVKINFCQDGPSRRGRAAAE